MMTEPEAREALKLDTLLNRARSAFRAAYAEVESRSLQRVKPTTMEMIALEFDVVRRIAKALDVDEAKLDKIIKKKV